MAKNPEAVSQREKNNSTQGGGADAKVRTKASKAAGGGGSNPTNRGGINRATKGR